MDGARVQWNEIPCIATVPQVISGKWRIPDTSNPFGHPLKISIWILWHFIAQGWVPYVIFFVTDNPYVIDVKY